MSRIPLFPRWHVVEHADTQAARRQAEVAWAFAIPGGAGPNIVRQENLLSSELCAARSAYMRAKWPILTGQSRRLLRACTDYMEGVALVPTMSRAA